MVGKLFKKSILLTLTLMGLVFISETQATDRDPEALAAAEAAAEICPPEDTTAENLPDGWDYEARTGIMRRLFEVRLEDKRINCRYPLGANRIAVISKSCSLSELLGAHWGAQRCSHSIATCRFACSSVTKPAR